MKTNIQFGMLQTVYQAEGVDEQETEYITNEDGEIEEKITTFTKYIPVRCTDPKCGRLVKNEDPCFIDGLSENGDVYCDACGKCLRYSRKKAAEREKMAKASC